MTREQVIKNWDAIQAFKNGKNIQAFVCGSWHDDPSPSFMLDKYRTKPEPTKRLPTIEEVEKWFFENKVFLYKHTNTFYRIDSFTKHPKQGDKVIYVGEWHTIKNFCEDHAHYNGSELYITEN